MIEPRHYDIAGLRLAGWYSGPPQGPLFLACHGWLDNADSFLPLAQAMPEHRILSLDWPGHGLSQHLGPASYYHFIDWADVLYQLIQQLNEPVILLGHSMGAMASCVLAASFPQLVSGLVLIEGFGPVSAEPEQAIQLVQQAFKSRVRQRNKQKHKSLTLTQAIEARLMVSQGLTENAARLLCLRNLEKLKQDQYGWRTDPRLKVFSPLRMTESQAQTFIAGLQCEVLAIIARQGLEFVHESVNQRKALLTKLELVELDGGHHLHMDAAQDVANQIEQWVRKIWTGSHDESIR